MKSFVLEIKAMQFASVSSVRAASTVRTGPLNYRTAWYPELESIHKDH